MEIRLLGPAVRVLVDGRVADAGTLKERSILAVLALSAGSAVPTGTLIERVWGPSPSASVRSSLYACIARIRSRMRAAGAGAGLRKRSDGYSLEIAPEAVDWLRVKALRKRAQDLAEAGEHRAASVLLTEALDLWEGDPLSELPGEWTHATRAEMNQTRLILVNRWAEASMRIGHHDDVVAVVSEAAAGHPDNEQLTVRLMEALAATGRHAEAVDSYNRLRGVLAEEGNNPGAATQEAFQRVLAGQTRVADEPASRVPAPGAPGAGAERAAPPPRVYDSLARDIGDFTARGPELAEILSFCRGASDATTVAVISGMAGVGKTALAVRAAHLLRDDFDIRLQLDLHGHSQGQEPLEPAQALHTLLRELEVEADRIPAEPQARAALWSSRLAGHRTLLVLDDAARGRIAPLIPGTPGCVVLVTSRWRLTELDGVHHVRLSEPSGPEAAGMLAAFAALGGGEDDPDVRRIAASCGRLPLALRVVGARLRLHPAWTPAHVADRLARKGLAEMRDLGHDVAAVFEMSFQALGAGARAAFLRIGAHPVAEPSLPALAAALGDASPGAAAAEAAAEELLETNLVEETAPGRYRMHALLHEFARKRAAELLPEEERRAALLRTMDHYWSAADAADRAVHPERRRPAERPGGPALLPPFAGAADARRWFDEEYSAIDAAITGAREGEFADAPDVRRYAVRLPLAVAGLADSDGPWERSERHLAACLELCRAGADEENAALAAFELSRVQRRLRRLDDAKANAEAALEQWRREGDVGGEALARDQLGLVHFEAARNSAALREHTAALELFRRARDARGCAETLDHVGVCRGNLGDLASAESAFTEASAIARAAGDRQLEARSLGNMAGSLYLRGRHRDAVRICERVLAVFEELGDQRKLGQTMQNTAALLVYEGMYDEAVDLFGRAHEVLVRVGEEGPAIRALAGMSEALVELGRRSEAWAVTERAFELAGTLVDPVTESQLMRCYGDLLTSVQRTSEARLYYRNACGLAGNGVSVHDEMLALDRLGDVYARAGRGSEATAHWRRAWNLAEAMQAPQSSALRIKIESFGDSGHSGHVFIG
ncbi:AfsR/SARP family transcriptional regulator [Streptomonospora arabica]|uniref:BTAD domain-containing putative transcriptional regulator n=1 Tax=Streptomonospora arabica TaxID=412417 RepID=A0ABV9SMG4_9ACTN